MASPGLLSEPTRFLFFTGKGGVGKTSLSTATALALADAGKRVLLVSTDAASNLDEMLGVPLRNEPVDVPGAPGLQLLNIDPENAAEAYRGRVLAQLDSASERETVREQLSGACTTEIAAFDEFSAILAAEATGWDHVVFDTAPTGHTLRLLSLPKAWTGFLAGNDRGASCLGPHSGLKMQERRFRQAMDALGDATRTTVVLVSLPDARPLEEAARAAAELAKLGLTRQRLILNGVFHATLRDDEVALALEAQGQRAIAHLPAPLDAMPRDEVSLRPHDMVGLPALRALWGEAPPPTADGADVDEPSRRGAPRADRRAGAGRPRAGDGDGQGRRRQDDHRRGPGGRARAAGASGAPHDDRPRGAPRRDRRGRAARP
jgi:arsenite-transporting ATPase